MASVIQATIMKDVMASPCFVLASILNGANQITSGSATQRTRPMFTRAEVWARSSSVAIWVVMWCVLGKRSPLLEKEGCTRPQENAAKPPLIGADGGVAHNQMQV